MVAHRLVQVAAVLTLAFVLSSPAASDIKRHCEAWYSWTAFPSKQKQRAIASGSFGKFRTGGRCGNSVPNRCRERAKSKAHRCMQIQWQTRLERRQPEACYPGNDVEGYSLRLPKICPDPKGGLFQTATVEIKPGDVKTRLEYEVCCWRPTTASRGQVVVDLYARSEGRRKCGRKDLLQGSYVIPDCEAVRRNLCNFDAHC